MTKILHIMPIRTEDEIREQQTSNKFLKINIKTVELTTAFLYRYQVYQ